MNQTLMPTTSRPAMKTKRAAPMRHLLPLLRHSLIASCLCIPLMATAATLTRTSAFVYDATSGMLMKEIIEPDNSNLCLVTEYQYDSYGNKHSATTRNCNGSTGEAAAPTGDPVIASRTTVDTYDASGQFPVTSSNALNQSESKTFDPKFGTVLNLSGPNGLATTWSYDSHGRKILEIRADGTQTKWDYLYCTGINGGTASCPTVGGAAGAWLIQATLLAADGTTQIGPVKKIYYDSLNREIRTETQGFDGTGTSTAIYQDTQYDNLGRAYKVSRPYYAGQTVYWNTMTYDVIGRVIQETPADGTTPATTQYNGLTVIATNAKVQTRTIIRNTQGQTISVTDTQNQTISYTYDPFGNLTQTQDAVGNITTLSYDLRGRKIQMIDPDMGTWNYFYDALGQLIRQVDAKNQTSTLAYDLLGRMTQRAESDLISNWYYDAYKGGGACNKGIGKLCQAETSTGYNRTHVYDNLGRASSTTTTLDTTYTVSVNYDASGRVDTQSYPSGLVAKYVYTTLGYLKEVRNNTGNALYWQANNFDAEGHLLQQTYGNNVVTQQTWNTANGRLTGILAGVGNGVQNLTYQYDSLGNITSRTDANQNLTETFVYDSVNRLTSSTVNSSGAGIVTKTYAYDAIGNITSRSDLGNYTYNPSGGGSVRPHALIQVDLSAGGKRTYVYDANGNLSTETQYDAANNIITSKGRAEYYTSFNMPTSMGSPGLSQAFYYGPEHQRIKQISSSQGTTYYLNPGNNGDLLYEKDIKPDNSIEQRSYITANGQVVAMVKLTGTIWSTRYLHRDHLGSLTAVTDEAGVVVERLSYEPFGKRRFATGSDDTNNAILPLNTDRGFTNHEHLDELTLIHMNGRIYDPVVGRFMSPDPYIQDPMSLQSYNRYSYLWNNPLGGVDPSGFFKLSDLNPANIMRQAAQQMTNLANQIIQASNLPGQFQMLGFSLVTGWALPIQLLEEVERFNNNAMDQTSKWLTDGSGARALRRELRWRLLPTPHNTFDAIEARPGQENIDNYILNHPWVLKVFNSALDTAGTGLPGGTYIGSAGFGDMYCIFLCTKIAVNQYYSFKKTGSYNDAGRAGAKAIGGYYGGTLGDYALGRLYDYVLENPQSITETMSYTYRNLPQDPCKTLSPTCGLL